MKYNSAFTRIMSLEWGKKKNQFGPFGATSSIYASPKGLLHAEVSFIGEGYSCLWLSKHHAYNIGNSYCYHFANFLYLHKLQFYSTKSHYYNDFDFTNQVLIISIKNFIFIISQILLPKGSCTFHWPHLFKIFGRE